MPFIAPTPQPPYYAVIFTSINAAVDHEEHARTSRRLVEVAARYKGFLGIEAARSDDGLGVAFSRDPEHRVAKQKGREIWYSHYMIRICRVEREYGKPD